ncbi:hypothetical protein [Cytobacillus sp. IB215316]|uniref:hypothetical protein n=1 Tax=Cytobacillus sp. IB215316 TaxID=3097354 RepID=UPI002A137314|nr:hypothetical protein [Cytobacillus sp. IB215316]MDX8361751.1 hypothetical protein [Cytobacillus sp. IB215316]
MDLPVIPELGNIDKDQALWFLIQALTENEIALARLMEAEANKVMMAFTAFKNQTINTTELLAITESVQRTLTCVNQQQILLNNKLYDIRQLITKLNIN